MTDTFTAQVSTWAAKSQKRLRAISNQSTMDVIEDAQLPQAKGGRMHVDTGFLRNSGQVSLNGMPTGPTRGDKNASYDGDALASVAALEIAKAQPGQTIFFGWTANYAQARENKDAFLRLAIQKWQSFVDKNVALAKARYK